LWGLQVTAFYNEINPDAAAHLRSLIAAGQIAPGIVDERSIEDVRPDELAGYAQCHFFAGLGIWALALRQAGVPDDYPVWSMSCPCQPFSAAGKGKGFADERHLWPAAYHLVSQCRPERIVGEQVASKDTNPWLDLVQVDLEALGYAFGCVPFPSAGVGAPHIRDRLYWVADTEAQRRQDGPAISGVTTPLDGTSGSGGGISSDGIDSRPSPPNGFWRDADWLYCRDGKWRPVEPGTFPLAHGMPRSMGALPPELRRLAELAGLFGDSLKRAKNYKTSSLKGYGNAINAEAAKAFIECLFYPSNNPQTQWIPAQAAPETVAGEV
jgi:DNA (cytosine-5)-methyltransferase 1